VALSFGEVIKTRGRPVTTGKGLPLTVRPQPVDLKLLDEWIAETAPGTSRPEAIRRIIRQMPVGVPL
jgi:hypothetical protein